MKNGSITCHHPGEDPAMFPKKTLLARAAIVAASLVLCALPKSANAAVTVIGSGSAQLCYDGAENGGSASEYLFYCNQALNSWLSTHDRAATYINRGVLRL